MRTVHYVGMDYDTYLRARRVWGGPAYYHKWMDDRVWTEVGDSDVVIVGDPTSIMTCDILVIVWPHRRNALQILES